MKKIIMSLISALALMIVANAQKPVVHILEYESFNNVKVSDDFIVKLVSADKYMVRTTVDGRIESYVKAYVQNGTLYISLDRKSFPSDLKKALRVKGAPAPILEVEISFPSIESMEMGGNCPLLFALCSRRRTLDHPHYRCSGADHGNSVYPICPDCIDD